MLYVAPKQILITTNKRARIAVDWNICVDTDQPPWINITQYFQIGNDRIQKERHCVEF